MFTWQRSIYRIRHICCEFSEVTWNELIKNGTLSVFNFEYVVR